MRQPLCASLSAFAMQSCPAGRSQPFPSEVITAAKEWKAGGGAANSKFLRVVFIILLVALFVLFGVMTRRGGSGVRYRWFIYSRRLLTFWLNVGRCFGLLPLYFPRRRLMRHGPGLFHSSWAGLVFGLLSWLPFDFSGHLALDRTRLHFFPFNRFDFFLGSVV